MKNKNFTVAFSFLCFFWFSEYANATTITVAPGSLTDCPSVGSAGSCAIEFRFNANGSVDTLLDPTVPSTDNIEDTLFGLVNNTSSTITSIHLDGTSVGSQLFGFEGDGQSTVTSTGPGNTYFGLYDSTAPGSRDQANTFNVINSFAGDVLFSSGIVAGGSAWWVLESQINFNAPPPPPTPPGSPVPIPAAVWLFGSGLIGLLGIRKKPGKYS